MRLFIERIKRRDNFWFFSQVNPACFFCGGGVEWTAEKTIAEVFLSKVMKTYMAELHRYNTRHNTFNDFIARLCIEAENRARAVHKAQLWYWETYRGKHGPAHRTLVINDPYGEVRYSPTFNCGLKTNRLLDDAAITRVLAEARGELVRDERAWRPHHPPGSVRRVKRRRDFGKFIAPLVRQMRNGVLSYRITRVPQKTRNGRRLRKRKYCDMRLEARTMMEAADEIERRTLLLQHKHTARRPMRKRSLALLRTYAARLCMAHSPAPAGTP